MIPGLVDDTRNSVLTLARIWLTVETGEIGPKDAADWALERLPRSTVRCSRGRALSISARRTSAGTTSGRARPRRADHVAGEIGGVQLPQLPDLVLVSTLALLALGLHDRRKVARRACFPEMSRDRRR